MILQKQLSRKVGNTEYAKWVLVIPPEKVKEAGLREGDEMLIKVKGSSLLLERKK